MASPWKELHLDELFFALAAGYAGHWLITPHPAATPSQHIWAWTQLLGGIGVYLYLAMRRGAREGQKCS